MPHVRDSLGILQTTVRSESRLRQSRTWSVAGKQSESARFPAGDDWPNLHEFDLIRSRQRPVCRESARAEAGLDSLFCRDDFPWPRTLPVQVHNGGPRDTRPITLWPAPRSEERRVGKEC